MSESLSTLTAGFRVSRTYFRNQGLAATVLLLFTPALASSKNSCEVLETKVISNQPEFYLGWSSLARRSNGELLLAWSGGRESHVCPFGRVEWMTSSDDGKTWSVPRIILDSATDDRDAGVIETPRGTILVTTFTSLAYVDFMEKALNGEKIENETLGKLDAARLEKWQTAHNRLSDSERAADVGVWLIRSTDGGLSWSSRIPTIVGSPHGPTVLSDGRLLYAGTELFTKERRIGVCESLDDGQTWNWVAPIPVRPGDDIKKYHELHAVEAQDGRIVAQIRNHNETNHYETLQTESFDGGKTWSVPRSIGVWGYPSFLLKLRDGRLLMSYGHRERPYGILARLSDDNGETWSEPLTISADGANWDLGYPSTVELKDGTFLTVWYEWMRGDKTPRGDARTSLRQARWRLN